MKYTCVFIFLFTVCVTNAQFYSEAININNVNAKAISSGLLFHNHNTSSSGFEVPAGSGIHTIYGYNLWIGAHSNDSSILYGMFPRYTDSIRTRPGPVMNTGNYLSQSNVWNYIWKIDKSEIIYHINNYNQPGYVMPVNISTWPAHGDTSLGQAQNLAPFIDVDNDGYYNPMNGDYPAIKGDQCLFLIFNDDLGYSENFKVEIHCMLYAFDCSIDSAFNNTVFVHYKIFNRSANIYYKTLIGTFIDFDIGVAYDDYFGTDVQRTSIYAYNADDYDETNGVQQGYGNNPPAQSATLLKGPLLDADGIDNPYTTDVQQALGSNGIVYPYFAQGYGDGIIDNERAGMAYSQVFMNSNFYNYFINNYNVINGKTPSGTDLYHHCSPVISKYIFTDNSDTLFYGTNGIDPNCITSWTEYNVFNPPGDRRGVLSTGRFTFNPGEEQEIEFAFVFGRDYLANTNANLASISVLQNRIDSIKHYYYLNQTPCGNNFNYFLTTPEIENNKPQVKLYPNPSNGIVYLEISNFGMLPNENLRCMVFDISGKLVYNTNITNQKSVLPLEFLADGLYYVVLNSDRQTKVQKFIISR